MVRVLSVQIEPKIGQVEANMATASRLLEPYTKEDGVDLVVLSDDTSVTLIHSTALTARPEMVFSGYVFDDLAHIRPYLEDGSSGKTVTWCRALAQRLGCYVIAGFPEVRKESVNGKETERYLNSCAFVDRAGKSVATYSKHFLYETDERWCEEGDAFHSYFLEDLNIRLGLGICMDINPYKFEAPFDAYELANFHKKENVDILVLSAAWCHHEEGMYPDRVVTMKTLNYWANRLEPLAASPVLFVVANRIGEENGTHFVGSSCAIDLAEFKVLEVANKTEEVVLDIQWEKKANA